MQFSFGKHQGRTFEWVIFHDHPYARWIYDKKILATRDDYTREEYLIFQEMFVRASNLGGLCQLCSQRRVSRRSIRREHGRHVAILCCERCVPEYDEPNVFLINEWPQTAKNSILYSILSHYLGPKASFGQADLEEFFRNDANFAKATPNLIGVMEGKA